MEEKMHTYSHMCFPRYTHTLTHLRTFSYTLLSPTYTHTHRHTYVFPHTHALWHTCTHSQITLYTYILRHTHIHMYFPDTHRIPHTHKHTHPFTHTPHTHLHPHICLPRRTELPRPVLRGLWLSPGTPLSSFTWSWPRSPPHLFPSHPLVNTPS